jgi:hypothetical protein
MVSVGDEGVRIGMVAWVELHRLGDLGRCGDVGSETLVLDRLGGLEVDLRLDSRGFDASNIGDLAGLRAGIGGDRGIDTMRLCNMSCTSSNCSSNVP